MAEAKRSALGGAEIISLFIFLFFSSIFAQSPVWNGNIDTTWYTEGSTSYTIYTAEELAGLAKIVNNGTDDFDGKTIKLGADILLNDITANGGWESWGNSKGSLKEWIPIGSSTTIFFKGIFDGNGYIISGMYIPYGDGGNNLGLFSYFGGEMKNLGLNAFYIAGFQQIGGLIGYTIENAVISNVFTNGKVSATEQRVGGFVGVVRGNVTISNSYALGSVSAPNDLGGLVGVMFGSDILTITNSYSTSKLDLVGCTFGTQTIENSYDGYALDAAPFTGWDPAIWVLDDEPPSLRWQIPWDIEANIDSEYKYTSEQIKPTLNVTKDGNPLTEEVDFTYEYAENLNVGNGVVTIVGQGTYSGLKKTFFFEIVPSDEVPPAFIPISIGIAIKDGMTLADISLPSGYSWKYKTTPLELVDSMSYPAVYLDVVEGIIRVYKMNNIAIDIDWYTDNKTGTEFTITTSQQLAGLAWIVNNCTDDFDGKTVKLGADILLNDITNWSNWGEEPPQYLWIPIGTYPDFENSRSFNGTFDGNGYIISGVYAYNPDSSGYGLFGYISYGKVTNLGVVASYVKGNEKVGGLVGFNNSGTISNCYAVGNVFGNNHVGSLIGAHGGIMVNNYAVGNRGLVGYFYDHYLKRIFSSYYDSDIDESYSIYGTSLTTAEMQSEDFVEKLNLIASSFSGKKWIYTSGEYPKLSGETITVVKYFSGGDGTEKNPYLIKTAEQLRYFSEFVNNGIAFSGEHIKLGDDIDLEGNDSNQWTPIGEDDDFPFRGTFDGDGHVISRVYINNSNENLGLFGAINNQEGEGIVKNLGVEASFVKGSNSIGLLVGYSNGTILNSYAKGIVEGKNNIGGLVGLNGKEVFNSYAIADVKGTSDIGGLVGKNSSDATINNSYFIEKEGGVKIGSLVGEYSGNILNNHYYEDVSDIDSKLADSLNSIAEFIIDAKAWKHNPGSYPTFSDSITGRIEKHFASGSGTESDPFIIINKTQLDTLSLLVSYGQTFQGKYIMLGNDINLKDDDWTPIGTDYYQFKGTFDGNGHVISGLYINEPGSNTLGLFGKLSSAGTIKNLGVTGTVNGHDYIGGLVGISYGKIINSYAKVNVNGYDYVGGLVGFNHQADADCYAIINNSYATGNVKGNDYVGGLVGHSAVSLEKAIINSYATGEVEGEIYVGGLIGFNSFTLISSSYATGKVKGNENVGGLLGQTDGGAIDSSYATGNVSGDSIVGGLVGFNANGNKINSSYAKGKVEGEKNIGGLAGINDTSGVIIDCYAVDSVKGDENIGGLAGQNMGSISNSYAIGNVDGKINFGGLTGLNSKKGFIDESYASWNVPESQEMALGTLVGKNESGGAISNSYGMSLKLMKIKNSFNWNFKSIWSMDPYSNDSLPYLQWQNKMNSAQYGEIETQVYTGSQIIPPKSAVTLNSITLTEGKDFEYKYGENINASPGGIVYIVGLKHEYFGTKIVNFVIKPNKTVRVTWFPECGYSFTYSGSPQSPMPISDYDLEIGEQGTDADSYTIKASLKNPEEDNDVTLENATCGYIIARKELIVEWTDERKFVYNRMTQSPEPTVYDGETKEIPLHINKPKAAGTHTVTAVIIDEKDRENYILRNNTVQFDILKKPLKPYFDTTLANFSTNSGKDTLWVPKGTFADSSAMHNALLGLINYDGFAKDSTGTDDKTAINGIPNVFLQYLLATSHSPLAKRVETTQKATATIITDNVSSDNYALARTNVVIMETVEEEEFVRKVSCMRGNYCTTLDEDVCEFISGKEVSKCDETPIAHTPYPIPHTLIVAKYFTLKGEPLGTIKPTTPGIYIEVRAEHFQPQRARKVIVK